MLEWTRDLPTVPGRYWFYGRMSKYDKIRLASAELFGNGWTFVVGGAFLYKPKAALAFWAPVGEIVTPPLPDDIARECRKCAHLRRKGVRYYKEDTCIRTYKPTPLNGACDEWEFRLW